MRKPILLFACVVLTAGHLSPPVATAGADPIQFIFTSDAHYGLTRAEFLDACRRRIAVSSPGAIGLHFGCA